MAGQAQDVLGAEHARPTAKGGLRFLVVQPGVAARDQEEFLAIDADAERLGNLPRLDAMNRSGQLHGGGGIAGDDHLQVGCAGGKVGADGLEAHQEGLSAVAFSTGRAGCFW
ncbi:hypothetical protein D3C87_1600660 [compost metagenome]